MKKQVLFGTLALLASQAFAQQAAVTGPDARLKLDFQLQDGKPVYSVTYDGKTVLENSPLGFVSNIGDFSRQMSFVGQQADKVENDVHAGPYQVFYGELFCQQADCDP